MDDASLREHLIHLLQGQGAHMELEPALLSFPAKLCGARVAGLRNTPWRLLEHMRISQWDILEFSRNPGHVSPEHPRGYWPDDDAPAEDSLWSLSIEQFLEDLRAMQALVDDPSTDLYTPLPHGTGQTILREALLVADHNGYHLGQLMMLRRALEGPEATIGI
jgi:hypothetical protein